MMTCRAPFHNAIVDTQTSAAQPAGLRSLTSGSGGTLALPSPRMQHSVNRLEAASQAVRLRLATKEQSDKSTPATYRRHVDSYVAWWDAFQAAEITGDSAKTAIPALPITAAKATMFLDYTSTRAKVSHVIDSHPLAISSPQHLSAEARQLGDHPWVRGRSQRHQTNDIGARKPPVPTPTPLQAYTRVANRPSS
jgi:hypothetical protein